MIDELAPVSPEGDVGPRLGRLVDCPRPVVDDEALWGVLAAAVSARNLLDVVIASAVSAAERVGVPGRRHLRSAADLLRLVGMAPGAAARAVRVGRMAPGLPALTTAQRLGWDRYRVRRRRRQRRHAYRFADAVVRRRSGGGGDQTDGADHPGRGGGEG
ncbi:hypothetical protein [Mycolicibacterium neoaurum]|uniref:hypothetical protein n=1 Tax=Mycolicibacterium neoaurum TaxID=1795 RepID=UPI002FF46E18